MDCRSVYIFLCVLIAQASCKPVTEGLKARALNATIPLMRTQIQTALGELGKIGQLPSTACLSLNISEMIGQEQRILTADNLSSFRCYMMKMSELTPEVASQLQIISQYTQHMELRIRGSTTKRECRQPTNKQDTDNYVFVRCLLELMDQRLSE